MTEDHLIELFNERSAIAEYCGKLPRHQAELQAYAELKRIHGVVLPVEIRRIVSESVNKELKQS